MISSLFARHVIDSMLIVSNEYVRTWPWVQIPIAKSFFRPFH